MERESPIIMLTDSAPASERLEADARVMKAPLPDGLGRILLRFEHLKHWLRPGDDFPAGSLKPHSGLQMVTIVLQGQLTTLCSTHHSCIMSAGHCQW